MKSDTKNDLIQFINREWFQDEKKNSSDLVETMPNHIGVLLHRNREGHINY